MTPVYLRVRALREARGISQRELGRLAGLSQKAISAIETGKSKGVDFTTLDRLALALDVDPAFLIVREDRREAAHLPAKKAPAKTKATRRKRSPDD